MGFHIVKQKDGIIESVYIRKAEEIVNIDDIDENTIVYEADEKWKPYTIKDNKELHLFLQDSVKYGLLGQQYFVEMMHKNKVVCEQIDQNPESLKQYIEIANGEYIKRGDYILRNVNNIEVEVKVRTFYGRDQNRYFTIDYSELKSLERMQKILNNEILFCVFQKVDKVIIKDTIYSIAINKLVDLNREKLTKYYEKDKYLGIPVCKCAEGLDFLKNECSDS